MKAHFGLLFLLFLLCNACGQSRSKAYADAREIDSIVRTRPDSHADWPEAEKRFIAFADAFPEHPDAPNYLHKAAQLFARSGKIKDAISLYAREAKMWGKNPKAAPAFFERAILEEDSLHQMKEAAKTYRDFLIHFPNHPLAEDARKMAERLEKGQTIDQYLDERIHQARSNDTIPS